MQFDAALWVFEYTFTYMYTAKVVTFTKGKFRHCIAKMLCVVTIFAVETNNMPSFLYPDKIYAWGRFSQ